jgi:hypothetical protein
MEGRNGRLGCIIGGHGDKRETAGAAGHLVDHQVDFGNVAVSLEGVFEGDFGRLEREVPDEQLVVHVINCFDSGYFLTVPDHRVSNRH